MKNSRKNSTVNTYKAGSNIPLETRKIISDLQTKLGSLQDLEIAIKVNLCYLKSWETGATTDPRVLNGILGGLKEEGARKIFVLESDATSANADLLFRWLGINKICKKHGADFVNLSKSPSKRVTVNPFYHLKTIDVPRVILDSDVFISLSKLKTHSLTTITCSLKNQFGCLPKRRKIAYHKSLDQVIADTNRAMKPDYSIVDGIIAMEGFNGPVGGFPRKANVIISGCDPVAVDSVCGQIMGFNPKKIRHIRFAERLGVGKSDFEIEGLQIKDLQSKFEYKLRDRIFQFVGLKLRGTHT